ncbi:hypothetical protein E2C01_039099 [Portunus trituberculatus]|uniref:Uncharacterized protein n=1 Tax=Portunus trituberculatus TaxID=210409 RepID=A0A5B7FDW6_PORTR|nr:hypothetical protein [Portunus trituberculatus]
MGLDGHLTAMDRFLSLIAEVVHSRPVWLEGASPDNMPQNHFIVEVKPLDCKNAVEHGRGGGVVDKVVNQSRGVVGEGSNYRIPQHLLKVKEPQAYRLKLQNNDVEKPLLAVPEATH